MNLIEDQWIPTDDGSMALRNVLCRADTISWGRGDWDAATRVLLAGLLQTAVVHDPQICPTAVSWSAFLKEPPDVDTISAWFERFSPYFEERVFEDYQDFDDDREWPISYLFPESAKDNTLEKTADISQWQECAERRFSEAEARIALYSDAQWGVRMGRGHRQGPRGGSRMTTLIEPESGGAVWQQIWLNVLPRERWIARFGDSEWDPSKLFPWTGPRLEQVSPELADPLTIYWAMPRRIRLTTDGDGSIRSFRRVGGGTEYVGWQHPLSPAVRIRPGHMGYQDWAGITLMAWRGVSRAVVVSEISERPEVESLRVRAMGWSLGSAGEAGAWIEHTTPLLSSADREIVEDLLDASEKQRKKLCQATTIILKGKVPATRRESKQRKERAERVSDRLYSDSEPSFYDRVRGARTDGWERELREHAIRLFDQVAGEFRCDPYEVARCRSEI